MEIPQSARMILERLDRAGFEAWLVGGCVRDLLMNVAPHDLDVATAALPQQTEAVFADCGIYTVGKRFGTVAVRLPGMTAEITTFRTEEGYSDGRRPDCVRFVGRVEEDLARRDFTVNSMALHPEHGLVDPFGGQNDLRDRILRATGDPMRRFSEDGLRILRLFRFASRLGFTPEKDTLAAAAACRERLNGVSAERITAELTELLAGRAAYAVGLMNRVHLLPALGFCGDAADASALDETADVCLRTALLCRQTGTEPERLFGRLRLSGAQQKRISAFSVQLAAGLPSDKTALKRRMSAMEPADWKLFADCVSPDGSLGRLLTEIDENGEPYRISQLAVNGTELLALGIAPEKIGGVLTRLLDEVIADPEKNEKKRLLARARCCAERGNDI